MRFHRLDLNLLVALDALLSERSVSLAAERMCLSQSATSSALARLRDYFNDELLTSKGRQMVLTPRAEELTAPVRAVLDQIRSTIAIPPPFDPSTSDRTIRIMASDYTIEVLLAPALLDMSRDAPGLRIEIVGMQDDLVEALERGSVDLLLSLDCALSSEHPMQRLFDDEFVVVGAAHNAELDREMTVERFLSFGHVAVEFGRTRQCSFDENYLRRHALHRRIEVVAPSFLSIPALIAGSGRIALMQRRLALHAARRTPLRLMPSPFDMPPIRQAVQWHRSSDNDPGLNWVVGRLAAFAGRNDDRRDGANIVPLERGRVAAARRG